MSEQTSAPVLPPQAAAQKTPLFSLDNRYIAPAFITCILLAGHLSFGILESYQKTLLAIVTSILLELVLGRVFFHKWVHPASAYISGISVGILVRSPAFWPYALCSAISITSKYVLRVKGRHFCDAVSGCRDGGHLEHSVGQLPLAHARDLGAGFGDYLATAALSHHWHLCRVVHRLRIYSKLDDRKPLAIGDCADYRSDVPTVHFLYDYRSEDHSSVQARSMSGRVSGGTV